MQQTLEPRTRVVESRRDDRCWSVAFSFGDIYELIPKTLKAH